MELSRKRASSSLNLECSQEHVQPLQSHVGSPLSSIPNVVSSSFDEPIFKKAWFRFGIAGRSVDEGQRRTHFPNMSTFTDGSQGCVDVKGRLVPGRYTLQNNALIRQGLAKDDLFPVYHSVLANLFGVVYACIVFLLYLA